MNLHVKQTCRNAPFMINIYHTRSNPKDHLGVKKFRVQRGKKSNYWCKRSNQRGFLLALAGTCVIQSLSEAFGSFRTLARLSTGSHSLLTGEHRQLGYPHSCGSLGVGLKAFPEPSILLPTAVVERAEKRPSFRTHASVIKRE